jgi:hypothetical protein
MIYINNRKNSDITLCSPKSLWFKRWRNILFFFSAVLTACFSLLISVKSARPQTNLQKSSLQQKNFPPKGIHGKHLWIKDWIAAGSGCGMTRMSSPGKTKVSLTQSPGDPNSYDIVFQLEKYHLDGDEPIRPQNAAFARECTIRLAVYPKKGKKISHIQAAAGLSLERTIGTKVILRSQLIIADTALADWQKAFEPGQGEQSFGQSLLLKPNRFIQQRLAQTGCEEANLVGVNFSFKNYRKSFKEKINVRLDDRKLHMKLQLTDCKFAPRKK